MNFVRQNLYSEEKITPLGIALNVAICIFSVVLLIELIFNFVFAGFYIQDHSMLPTLNGAKGDMTGDYIFINRFAEPERFDIVIIEDTDTKNIIKRVVAFGGDTVKFEEGVLYLKYKGSDEFVPIDEWYIDPDNNTATVDKNGHFNRHYNTSEHVVEEGCMYLVGDNRNVSSDSRDNGDYSMDQLLGVVCDWSMESKNFTSSWYVFINKTVPEFFGFKSNLAA